MPLEAEPVSSTPTGSVAVYSTMPTMLTIFFYIVMTGHAARKAPVCRPLPLFSRRRVASTNAPGGECAICFGEYVPGSYQLCLPCGHVFHSRCLTRWIARSATCPLCRRPCTELGRP